ncbi:hypothetical protein [Parasporobacterium paucivorans]|nr:hypothetical protein [Parasporobacterium paucivorans]
MNTRRSMFLKVDLPDPSSFMLFNWNGCQPQIDHLHPFVSFPLPL